MSGVMDERVFSMKSRKKWTRLEPVSVEENSNPGGVLSGVRSASPCVGWAELQIQFVRTRESEDAHVSAPNGVRNP